MDTKKHLLVFESPTGTVLTIETDFLSELSEQRWFSQFISDAVMIDMKSKTTTAPSMQQQQEQYAQAQQQFVQQQQQQQRTVQQDPYASSVSPAMQRPLPPPIRQEVPRAEFLSYTPDGANGTRRMDEKMWATLSNEQRLEWGRFYNIKLST